MADAKLTALTGTSVPALDDLLYTVDVSDTTDDAAGSSRSLLLSRLLGIAGVQPGGRLTTESGVGVSTSDRTSQSTLYYTPFVSDYVRLYDGTRVREYLFTERSLSLSGLTSGKNYDVWLYDNSGTLTLELLVWTNDTTRATALAWQSGLGWVKSGDATRLYLGTIRTTGTTTTTDSKTKRFVWNAYNRVARSLVTFDTTDSWTYSTLAWRQSNGSAANQVEVVAGLEISPIRLTASTFVSATAVVGSRVGIGVDATTTNSATVWTGAIVPAANSYAFGTASLVGVVPLGYHYYAWLERGSGSGTVTWYGDTAGDDLNGMAGSLDA